MSEAAAMTYRSQREKAGAAAYVQALRESEAARAALADAMDAVAAERLEARMNLEKARQAAAAARSAVLAQAWGAGHFKDTERLGEAVAGFFAGVVA